MAINLMDCPHTDGCLLDDGKRDWVKVKCEQIGPGYLRRPGNIRKEQDNHCHHLEGAEKFYKQAASSACSE